MRCELAKEEKRSEVKRRGREEFTVHNQVRR